MTRWLDSLRSRSRRWKIAAVVAGVTVTASVGAVLLTALLPSESTPVTIAQQDPREGGTKVLASLPFEDAWDRIEASNRPFVAAVAGDSTGNAPGEWVDLAFRQLAVSTDRPLTIHFWNPDIEEYDIVAEANSDARNAPLIVWNGSASGRTAAYSLEHIDALFPKQPDVMILNHGLNNVRNPATVGAEFSAFVSAVEDRWTANVGYAVVLENPRFDKWEAAFQDVVANIEAWAKPLSNVLVIDVHNAYLDDEDVSSLLFDDHLHPNSEGSSVTARTVLDAISAAVA